MVIYKRANNMVKVSNKQTMGSFGASNINKKRIEILSIRVEPRKV